MDAATAALPATDKQVQYVKDLFRKVKLYYQYQVRHQEPHPQDGPGGHRLPQAGEGTAAGRGLPEVGQTVRPMRLLAALGGEQTLLPHFIRHYTALGVTHFHLAVREGTTLPDLPPSVILTTSYAGPHDMMQDWSALQAIQAEHVADDEWFFVLDGDEFARPPFPLADVLAEADARGCDWVAARLVDRVAADGSLPPVLPDSDLERLFPQRLLLTPLLLGGPMSKSVLVKGRTEITPGHHYCEGRVLDVAFEIDHYKWHAGVVERLRTRAALYRHVGYDWWVQSQAFLDHFARHGQIDLTRFLAYI